MGAGLAGCLLSWRLRAEGKSVLVIGDPDAPCAASVAAGVINPVTGRWAVKSWNIDALLPEAIATYRSLEKEFKIEIFHSLPMRRFCRNSEDLKRIGRRSRNPRYKNVIGDLHPKETAPKALNDPCGSFDILNAAYVDLPPLLGAVRSKLKDEGFLIEANFEHSQLIQAGSRNWSYKDICAQRVLFCEGAAVKKNPWFAELPMTPIKGETLRFSAPDLELPNSMFHNGKWLLPYGEKEFRIGATYDEFDPTSDPTESGRLALLEGLKDLMKTLPDITVKEHLAGLRPSTEDARPIIGEHSTDKGIFIFNGLGSKGTSVAPLMTREFCDHLLHGTPFNEAVSITRFK